MKTIEYKLGEVGYSDNEIEYIKTLKEDEINTLLNHKYNVNITKLMKEKKFIFAKQIYNIMKEPKNKKTFERTIKPELYEAWQMLYRTKDVEELMEITGKSYPIIQRALMHGHVKNDELCDTISKFYEDRSKKQKGQAKSILENLI